VTSFVSWGVLGTARIGIDKVIPAMQRSERGRVDAIASRSLEAARRAASALDIAKAYGSYEELLADPAIDAVYNPLPNHLHVPWTVRAMQAGKHVLCEKPIALTSEEARGLVEVRKSTGKQVLEAFMVRQHPQWIRTLELIGSGRIGVLRAIQTALCYFNADPANVRNRIDIGGGGLYDIGCYAVATARFLFGAEPSRAVSLVDRDPQMRIDRLTSGLVEFPQGRQLAFTCSTQLARYQRVQALGTKGRVEIQIPLNAPPDRPTRIFIDDASTLDGGGITTEEFAVCDQYTLQADEAAKVFLGEAPAQFPIEDAIRNMMVIDALYLSAKTGRWENIGGGLALPPGVSSDR
jgi:predicted dehydrogenase